MKTAIVPGDRIESVQRASLSEACKTAYARNRFLIPGLDDTHIHMMGCSSVVNGDHDTQDAILSLLMANGVTTAGTPAVPKLRDVIYV